MVALENVVLWVKMAFECVIKIQSQNFLLLKVNPAAQVAADQFAAYNPGVQAGAGQGFSNQNSGQFAAQSQGQEGDANVPYGYASYIDTHSHEGNGPAGAAAGYGMEVAEPVLSDMSGLDPVYSFRSRSSYNNGRVVFVRTSYNPAEPAVMPVYRSVYAQNMPASQDVQTNIQANDQVKARQWGFYW